MAKTKSFLFDHDIIWSLASFSGNIAGCLNAIFPFADFPLPVEYSQILPFILSGFILLLNLLLLNFFLISEWVCVNWPVLSESFPY